MMSIQLLPNDIQVLIVDFLSIDDCYTLQEVNNNFFKTLQIGDSFWAKKVFERHIQYLNKSLNLFKYSDSPVPYYVPTSIEFQYFRGAKSLWEGLMQSKQKLSDSFNFVGLENERAQFFSQRVYAILSDPSAPLPSLKRETQCIPTSSCFENFLTEIHFNVCPKAKSFDQDYQFLEQACDVVQRKLEQSATKQSNNKIVSKKPLTWYKKRLNKQRMLRKNKIQVKIDTNTMTKAEKVFIQIQNFIRSHCKIIKNYLFSLSEDKIILKEYRRCWKEFTYSMIEMNSLMGTYEDLLNTCSNKNHFSTWKGMVQIWLDEVYNKIALKVKGSFQNLLMEIISSEVINQKLATSQKSRLFSQNSSLYDQIEAINNDQNESDHEKIMKLLLKSFIALSDISLCRSDLREFETSDFSQLQPKLKLVNFLFPQIKNFVETIVVTLDEEPYKLKEVLATITSVLDKISNAEISLEKIPENSLTENEQWKNLDAENESDSQEIAGQYKIVSRCKWDHRLSEVYQTTVEASISW